MASTKTTDRQYLGFEDADKVEWLVKKEYEGRKNWNERWGNGRWMKEHQKWICSGINRAMRKPSFRSVEWLAWQRKFEVPQAGEWCTRKEVRMEPKKCQCCRPCRWPITTAGEVGWLGQHRCCQLEIYPNDFMKKPPMPQYSVKISSFLANSQ